MRDGKRRLEKTREGQRRKEKGGKCKRRRDNYGEGVGWKENEKNEKEGQRRRAKAR